MSDPLAVQLPRLNAAALAGDLSYEQFLETVRPPLAILAARALAIEDRAGARWLLGAMGLVLSSAERHGQAAGHERGDAVERLDVTRALAHLGRVAEHPPRDSAYTYWAWNEHNDSFTGDTQEALFGRVVRDTLAGWEATNTRLRFLADPRWSPSDPEILRYLSNATELQALNNRFLAALAELHPVTREEKFSGTFFTYVFRTFLTTYPIDGRTWEGPSAANFGAVFVMDLLLTPPSRFFAQYVRGRLHTLPGEEQRQVEAAMAGGTIEDRVLGDVGIDRAALTSMTDGELDARVGASRVGAFLTGLERYVDALTLWSKRHLGLVRKKLEQPAAKAVDTSRLPIDPSRGTGGGDWRHELQAILSERANPPILRRLFASAARVHQPNPENRDEQA